MKRFFIFTFLLLSFFISIAQPEVGIRGGLTRGFTGKKETGVTYALSAMTGLAGGMFVAFPMKENLYFQPEIMFESVGVNATMKGLYTDFESEFRLYYVDFPLLFKYNINSIFFNAGPFFGVLADARGEQYGSELENSDIIRFRHKVNAGLAFGGGTYIDTKVGKLAVELRIAKGFTNIYMEPDGSLTDPKGTTLLGAVYVTYFLNFTDVFGPGR